MKKIIVLLILAGILSGCSLEQKAAWDRFWQQDDTETLQLYHYLQQQQMYNAQYDYYTRPYEVGGVIHVP